MSDLEFPAGIKLDRLVCEEVFGFHSFKDYYNGGGHYLRPDGSQCGLFELPKPSRCIADAFQLFNHVPCPRSLRCDAEGIWWAEYNIDGTRYVGRGETAMVAICRGAWKTKEGK